MKAAALIFFLALTVTPLARSDEVVVPRAFLKTDISPWLRILATPVSGNFDRADVLEAAMVLARGTGANFVTGALPTARGKPVPLITRKLEGVSLRTALYLLAQDTGAIVQWRLDTGGFPKAIEFNLK